MKINTLEKLESVALARRSVTWDGFDRPQPAAWVISMQARQVLMLMRQGMKLYQKPKK